MWCRFVFDGSLCSIGPPNLLAQFALVRDCCRRESGWKMYYIILLYKKYIVLSNFFFYSTGKALAVLKERGHEEFSLIVYL